MANISKIKVDDIEYDVKDSVARTNLNAKVSKQGDTMSGDLKIQDYGVLLKKRDNNGVNTVSVFQNTGNGNTTQIYYGKEDWSEGFNFLALHKTKSEFGKPLTISSGGTGCSSEAELKAYLQNLLGLN